MRRYGKGKPHLHSSTEMFERSVDKSLYSGEIDNGIKSLADLTFLHSKSGPAQVNFLSAGELGVKSRADFKQTSNPAMNFREPRRRARNARKNFQEGRFPSAVPPNQADDLSLADVKGDIPQGP